MDFTNILSGCSYNYKSIYYFKIHPCDPTDVISYLIWPSDIAVHNTHLVSHSSSLSYHRVIEGYFGLVCPAGALVLQTRAYRTPARETS